MNGLTSYILSKKYVDDSLQGAGALKGKDGKDGKSAYEIAKSNGFTGTEVEWLESLKGTDGLDGKDFEYSDFTEEQLETLKVKGDAGVSPTITENANNTDKIYKLDITTADTTFTTPNLKGADGQGGSGGSGEENKIEVIKVNGVEQAISADKSVDITVPTVTNDLTDELKSSYDDAVTAKHTHENGTVLDGITAEKVEAWDKAEENVQSDWNETDDTADGFIKNKPTIPEAYDDTELSERVTDVEDSIGDMSLIEVSSVSDLVSAINTLYNSFMSGINYADKKLTITYRNGSSVDIDMSAIITDTKLTELSDVDDTGITDKQVLSYDSATSKYIPTTIDTAGVLADAKKYTDDEIKKINNADAIAVDEKPTYSDGTITYKKGGVESTITDGDFWFFYTVDDMAYQTIWIDGVEFTTSVDGSVDFKDFVSKTNDLASTYTGEETDKTKVATIASLDALYAIISTALGKKVNTTDIVDSLVSDATDKPLSAAQGKALDGKKVDKVDGMALSSNDYTDEEKSLVATIEDKVDKTSIVTALDDTVTDEQVASALLAKTELDKKIDKTSIVTELSEASTDDEVVGALTTYNELQKLESANKEQFATASGDYITVNDSVDGKLVELGIKGNSFQQTYTGKNLLSKTNISYNATGLTITDNKNGTYDITSGTTTGTEFRLVGAYNNLTKEIHLDTSKTYKITAKIGSANLSTICVFTDGSTYTNVNSTQNLFTLPDGFEDISSIFIRFDSSASYSGTLEVMLYEYTEGIDETFEPYVGGVPSPNPNYPQAINSVGDDGSLVVTSCGKNLIPFPYYNGSDTRNGITATVNNDDGSITLNGTATNNYFFVLIHRNYNGKGFARQFRGKTITISGGTSSPVLSLAIYDENGNNITPPNNEMLYDFGGTITITVPENACDMYSYYYCSSGAVLNTTLKPQLEVGEVATEYEPYKGSTTTIPLSEPLRAIGDIKDEITYQDGKWGVLRRIKRINANDLTWHAYSDYVFGDGFTSDILPKSGTKAYCNIAKINYPMTNDWAEFCFTGITSVSNCHLNVRDTTTFPTITEWNTYIASNDVYFDYPLATPTFTPFADQTLPYLSTYDGVTNISNDDALSAEMTVKYPTTDASGVGSRNESRIADIDKNKVDKSSVVTTLGSSSTDTQVPSAKAVWNKSKNKIQRLLDGVDIIVYADSIGNEMVTDTVRIMNATNSPYGVDNVNNDFYYTIYNMNDDRYKRILAYDIRKNDMYMIMKNNNIWGTWAKLATMDKLGGLTFSASGTTLSITDGTNTWTLEANS